MDEPDPRNPWMRRMRIAFMLFGVLMAGLYFRDAATTGSVPANVLKGSVWVLIVLATLAVELLHRRVRSPGPPRT